MKKKTKPMAKMSKTEKKYETSALDKKVDKVTGYKEGSKKDIQLDKILMAKKKK